MARRERGVHVQPRRRGRAQDGGVRTTTRHRIRTEAGDGSRLLRHGKYSVLGMSYIRVGLDRDANKYVVSRVQRTIYLGVRNQGYTSKAVTTKQPRRAQ